MRSTKAQVGVIIGALLTAMVIVALPRSAAASGGRFHRSSIHVRRGFVHPHRSVHSRHRFGRFHRGVHHHGFHRNRVYHQGLHHQKFHYTGHGHAFTHFNQVRDHHGYVRQGLGYGGSLNIFRR